ncbi:MAG: hypothetical protein WDM89_08605 [Rhizomicrobium sp.]
MPFMPPRWRMAGGRRAIPGPRQAAFTTYIGAFIFDPDGNKIEAVYFPKKLGEATGFAGAPKSV